MIRKSGGDCLCQYVGAFDVWCKAEALQIDMRGEVAVVCGAMRYDAQEQRRQWVLGGWLDDDRTREGGRRDGPTLALIWAAWELRSEATVRRDWLRRRDAGGA